MRDLKSILKNGFFPHYCLEYSLGPVDIEAASKRCPPTRASPMVCFCDLPLSLIRKHLNEYGNFAIGLSKQWGVKRKVAPVIYTHSKAKSRPPPVSCLTDTSAKVNDKTAIRYMNVLAAYTKPIEGPAWRRKTVQKQVRFYDEREWRYVPDLRGDLPLFLDQKDLDNTSRKTELHTLLMKEHALSIHPRDIRYLIVHYDKREKNVIELHDFLMMLYARRYGRKLATVVTTAIMTDDCIHEDV